MDGHMTKLKSGAFLVDHRDGGATGWAPNRARAEHMLEEMEGSSVRACTDRRFWEATPQCRWPKPKEEEQ